MIIFCMGLIVDNGLGGYIGYWMLKVVFNVVSVSLVYELKEKEIVVGLFYLGFV